MKFESPKEDRAQIAELEDGLYMEIAFQKNWMAAAFMGFWLCGWAIGEIFGLSMLLGSIRSGELSFVTLFMLGWVGFWTVGGFLAAKTLLWIALGYEQVVAALLHKSGTKPICATRQP